MKKLLLMAFVAISAFFGSKAYADIDDVIRVIVDQEAVVEASLTSTKILFGPESFTLITATGEYEVRYDEGPRMEIALGVDGVESVRDELSGLTISYRQGSLSIEGANKPVDLAIVSANGMLVYANPAFNGQSLDVSGLTAGAYIVKANSAVIKFIKK